MALGWVYPGQQILFIFNGGNMNNYLQELTECLENVCNKKVSINEHTDLVEDKILDSLDSMVFFLQFEEKFGIQIPEEIDLKEHGYYKVEKLLRLIQENKS